MSQEIYDAIETLEISREGHVATVQLAGPSKGNAMVPELWGDIERAFHALDRDPEVRAVVLHGRGDHFTFGLDLVKNAPTFMQLMQSDRMAAPRTELLDMVLEWQRSLTAIETCRKPVIAAIHGWCLGGGVNVIAACDMRLASKDAQISLREVKIAITPDLGALQRLPAIIGQGHTRRLALTGETIGAERALAINLVEDLYEDREALLAGAHELARAISDNPPLVVQGIKRVMNYCADKPREAGLEYVAVWNSAFLTSNDMMEAMTAFMEKRDPVYKGE